MQIEPIFKIFINSLKLRQHRIVRQHIFNRPTFIIRPLLLHILLLHSRLDSQHLRPTIPKTEQTKTMNQHLLTQLESSKSHLPESVKFNIHEESQLLNQR